MIQNKKLLKAVPLFGAFVLCACNSVPAERVTYDLLWDTKLEKLENHMVVKEKDPGDGIPLIYREVNGKKQDYVKVLMITDSHLDHKKPQCNYTFTMIAKNIMAERPDLVIFGGDNVTSIENEPRARQFCQMLEDLNVYWSCCLGNHEGDQGDPEKGQTGLTREAMVNLFASYDHCLLNPSPKKTKDGKTVRGIGNNAIRLLNSKDKVAQTIYFLDTDKLMSSEDMTTYANQIAKFKEWGKASADETEFYDFVHDDQIQWYKETMQDSGSFNSIVVSHVPLLDMEDAYLAYYNKIYHGDEDPETDYVEQGRCGGADLWPYTSTPGEAITDLGTIKLITGCRAESMCYSPHDLVALSEFGGNDHTPMFNAMFENGGFHPAFFCGHDHSNDFFLEVKPKADNDKTIMMGYIESACYSSNNYWSNGLLGWNPYDKDESKEHHLMQGYSVALLDLKEASADMTPVFVRNYTNYEKWNEYYEDALHLVEANRGPYEPAKNKFINDPNDPIKN